MSELLGQWRHIENGSVYTVYGVGKVRVRANWVRERLAATPDFPKRCGDPRWKASDILAWRDAQQKARK